MAGRVVTLTLWFALSCGGNPAPAPLMPPAAPTPLPEVVEVEKAEPQLVAQAQAQPQPQKPETPEGGVPRFLAKEREAEAPEGERPAKQVNPFVGDSKTGHAVGRCNGGKCPAGSRCGSAPGRPRKVCIATGQHRSGPRNMFERTGPGQ